MENFVDHVLASNGWTPNTNEAVPVATADGFRKPATTELFANDGLAEDASCNKPDTVDPAASEKEGNGELKASSSAPVSIGRKKSFPKKRTVLSTVYEDSDTDEYEIENGSAETEFAATLAHIKAEPECGIIEMDESFESSVSSLAADALLQTAEVLDKNSGGIEEDILGLQVQFQNTNPQKVLWLIINRSSSSIRCSHNH